MVKITQMKKTTLRQSALRLALVALVLLSPLGLRAQETVTSFPFNCGFETNDDANYWQFANGTTNEWVIGTAKYKDGAKGLYISNNGGTSYARSSVKMSSYAYVTMTLSTSAEYTLSFNWTANGESNYDYIRVFLAPESAELTGDRFPDGSTIGGYSTISSNINVTPTGWQNLSDGKLNLQTSWQTKTKTFTVTENGNYKLVFMWIQDDGTNDPAAIDNVVITASTCPKPTGLAATLTPGNGTIATLNWTAGGSETNWVVEYSTASDFSGATQVTSGFTTSGTNISVDLTGLTAEQTYYARVKADCGGGDVSEWSSETGIYFTPTDAYSITINDQNTTTNSYIPIYGSYVDWGNRSQFIIPATTLTNLQWGSISKITFYATQSSTTFTNDAFNFYMKEVPSTTFASTTFEDWDGMSTVYSGSVAISDNKMVITFDNPYTYQGGNLLIGSQQTAYNTTVSCTWVGVSQSGNNTALYQTANSSHSWSGSVTSQQFLPKLTIEYTPGVAPSCLPPTDLYATEDMPHESELSWTANNGETSWTIYYKKTTEAEYTEIPDVVDNPYPLDGLDAATTYQFYVVANCSESSDPSQVYSFTTACDVVTIPANGWIMNFDSYAGVTSGATNNLPVCWNYINTCTYSSYKGYPVIYNGSSYSNSGNNHLRFYSYYSSWGSYDPQPQYAILPEMNNLDGKQITLYARGYNATSTFKIGRMTDPEDASTFEPIEIESGVYEQALTTSYQEFTYELTGNGNYIAIMIDAASSTRTTNSVYIDDIVVETIPSCKRPSALKLETPNSRTAHTATLSWTAGDINQSAWQIAYSTDANFDPNTVTPVDVTTNPATVEGLAQSTTYYAYVRANCGGGDYSAWNAFKATFQTLAGNVTPTGLAVAANTITSDQATASWNAVAGNTLHQSYDIYWVESPDAAPVTAVPENPTAPNLISGITATSQLLSGLAPETQYRVWVRDNCGTDGLSAWSSYVTFTTASACNTPSNLVASNVTNNSAQLSWAAYGIDNFNLQYRVNGEEWDDNNIITNVNTPYILSLPLTGNTTYQVRVQATCTTDDSWSNTVSFTTACDPEPFPWSENFDTWTSKSVCWSFRSGAYNMGAGPATTNASAWTLSSTYGSNITIDGKALAMNLYSSNRYWAVTPAIDITTDDAVLKVDVAVAAWSSATPNYDDNDTLAFAISTDGGNTFTNLRVLDGDDLNNLNNEYTTILVPVAGYNGQAVRFAIYGGSISGTSPYDNRCVIDNVSVEEAPACYPVGTLAEATDITPFSAKLSWGLIDNTQDGWRITYATNAELTENMHAITVTSHENYTLSGLTPETHYYVAVCAFCGATGYGAGSNIIEFTTGIACQKPTDLAYSNLQQTSVDLSWTENGTASAWKVAYKAEDAADFSETMVLENPYTLNGLTQGTNYTVKVRAICGGDYGNSQWSDEINFQTVAACPAPTNLAVTPNSETGHGATITWEGTNDSYTIEYAEGPLAGVATLLEEDFDGSSLPTDWNVSTTHWSVNNSDNAGGDAYEVHLNWSPSLNGVSRLVTPAIDLTGITEVTFALKHDLHYYSSASAPVVLGIATSSDGGTTWNEGWSQSYSDNTSGTISEVISTSDMGNANVQFCIFFSGNTYDIDDWYFDDITITAEYTPTYTWNVLESGVTGNEYDITSLDPETQYVVRVKGVCGGTPSPASNIVGFETPEACPAPTNVTVNNSTITDNSAEISWDGSASSYNVRYRTATYRPTYYFNDFNESSATGWSYSGPFIYGIDDPITGTPSGANYFLAMGWSTTDEETIISPELPAYSNGSVVEFYYFGYSISNTFQVGYSSTTSDADAFSWGSPITAPLVEYTLYSEQLPAGTKYVALKATASEQNASIFIDNFGIYNTEVPAGEWTTTTATSNSTEIDGLTESTLYDVAVQAVCGSDLSAWVATTFTTLEACAAPTAFTQVAVAADEVTFSWTAGNGNTSWDVYVKAQGGDYPITPNATVTTPEATIDNLVANTSYSVKIVPDCDGTKSLEVANAFHTLCSVIPIDADNPYNEGFEGTVDCWSTGDPETTSGYGYNWTLDASYSHSNNYSITNGNYYGPVYLYTPTFNITGANAVMSFWSYNRYPSDYDKNSVLVTTDGGANWTEIWSPSSVSEEWVLTTIDLTAYIGQNIKFCFLFEGNNAHQWNIDDVELYVPASHPKDVDANKWYAIASPVHNNGNNQTLAGVSHLTDVDYDLYGYTESAGTWNKPTTVLERGKGYIYRAAADVTLNFVGINNSSVPAYTLSYACDDDDLKGFNLVGNPYPQSATPGMVCYSLKPEGIWYAQPATYQASVCEAVLVKTNGTGNSVTFTTGSGAKGVTSALAFTVSNEEFEDVAYARFDNGESLPKIGHLTAEAPMLSIPVDSRRYAIANLGNDCESFNLAFRGTNGSYTLTLKDNMAQMGYVHLIDRATGRDIDLLRQSYTFSATGNDADRFTVKLSPDAIESAEGHFAYWNGDNWVVEGNGKLQVIDVVGRQVLSQEVDSQTTLTNAQFPGTGVYILRMAGKSQKIVVK